MSPRHSNKNTKKKIDPAKRRQVLCSLCKSETKYVNHLKLLADLRTKLQKEAVLSIEQTHRIFSNIDELIAINSFFLNGIANSTDRYESPVGQIFYRFARHFKSYSTYVANFPSGQKTLTKLLRKKRKNKKFRTIIGSFQSNGLNIRDLLVMPVQRVPRYNAVIETLLNHTGSKVLLRMAYKAMKETTAFIDNSMASGQLQRRQFCSKQYDLELMVSEMSNMILQSPREPAFRYVLSTWGTNEDDQDPTYSSNDNEVEKETLDV